MRTSAVIFLVLLLSAGIPRAERPAPPKLVVLLVVDQMRADYVDEFSRDWTGGLKRLVSQGAWFRRAAYPYLNTFTCPGHATIATGAFPAVHGISQNTWWDRATGTTTTCTADPQALTIRYDARTARGGETAGHLLAQTLADQLRTARASHVVSVSLKERTAIMLAGHGGDAVTWLSDSLDQWETSSAFTDSAVESVRRFVTLNPIDADYGKTWSTLLPDARYRGPDDAPGESPAGGWTRTFPHVLDSASGKPDVEFYSKWERSPYADAYVARFAAALAESFHLGRHDTTDLLAVGFGGPDLVGHGFGPRSREVQDMFAHLDRSIGTLLDRLDVLVGQNRYVVALSADHGVTPIPEQDVARRHEGGRFGVTALIAAIDGRAQAALGPGRYVSRVIGNDIYLEPGTYDRLKAAGALHGVEKAIAGLPGVAGVFRGEQLAGAAQTNDPLRRAAALSYVAGRSGDLVVALKPGWISISNGTTHGSATLDDQRVPIILMGPGIRPGKYGQQVTPADIAPTLAALCGVPLPQAEGRVLSEALDAHVR
jgi:predicted AlkP superfamily pyrophosphatase or phosphodiesterase